MTTIRVLEPGAPWFPVLLLMASCSVPELGRRDGRLLPCPDRPNCVASRESDPRHRVDAFPLEHGVAETRAALKAIVAAMPRTVVLAEESDYLRFQFTSFLLRFKDDLEFHLVPAERLVHVRSAARVGYYDFGVNRARVATVRRAYDAWLAHPSSR